MHIGGKTRGQAAFEIQNFNHPSQHTQMGANRAPCDVPVAGNPEVKFNTSCLCSLDPSRFRKTSA